ncbi:MarR family winged helix-turn-helix transcriptional regulator [Limnohabitans sp.]|uniref:MarR family winged helix-turn-helix transcriptional regulator n=1 Tax=Limnohabitans sp. TaxID=1907725 RepID=UPI003919AFED
MKHFEALNEAPGHMIRRLHQIAVAAFAREVNGHDITPVQFGLLHVLVQSPGLDQVTLAKRVALDAATSGSVISRLEAKGWIERSADRTDRRRKLLMATPQGKAMLERISESVNLAQERMLEPLSPAQRSQFMQLLIQLVRTHECAGDHAD